METKMALGKGGRGVDVDGGMHWVERGAARRSSGSRLLGIIAACAEGTVHMGVAFAGATAISDCGTYGDTGRVYLGLPLVSFFLSIVGV